MLAIAFVSALLLCVDGATLRNGFTNKGDRTLTVDSGHVGEATAVKFGGYNSALDKNGSSSSGCVYPAKIRNQADYYWRDYFGVIPNDAILGGYTEDGNVTYIGQTGNAKSSGIYPGNIYPGKKAAEICDGVRFIDDTYIKILCSDPRNKFEWRETTINDSPLLTDYHWPIGGLQPSRVLYIGRAYIEGEVKVGRVYDITYPHSGLWICNKAGHQVNFKTFELLVLPR